MRTELIIEILVFGITAIFLILQFTKRGMISLKYAIIWLFSLFVIVFSVIVPNLMQILANILGFELLSNMLMAMFIGILILVSISLTIIVSSLREKVRMLTQEVSLIKKDIDL